MSLPEIDGVEVLGVVGEGSCGIVYIGRNAENHAPIFPDAEWYAVRVLNSLAVNRALIEEMVKRAESAALLKGVAPVVWRVSEDGAHCMVTPLYADADESKGTINRRSLEERIDRFPSEESWQVIDQIASALAGMHQRHLPHGNFQPGNIFFDENGEVILTDYAMGLMPAVAVLPCTDALLYAPPEQFAELDGYTTGKGCTWDTYAFGVIAFRLLTGKFPCVASAPHKLVLAAGKSYFPGSQVDIARLMEGIEYKELANWPEEACDGREKARHAVIQRCLSIDPEERYKDLTEVAKAWQEIDHQISLKNEKKALRRRIKFNKWGMMAGIALGAAGVAACLFLLGLLALEKSAHDGETTSSKHRIKELKKERDAARVQQLEANAAFEKSEEREAKLRSQLVALGVTNDRVLEWALRSQDTDLPELKQVSGTADLLERELGAFLELTKGDNEYQPIRARIAMQLAELAIHQGKPERAHELLDSAVASWTAAELSDPAYGYRVARAWMIILLQSLDQQNQPLTEQVLPKARQAVGELKTADPTEVSRIKAVMQIVDGRLIQASDPSRALEHFQSAIKELKGISTALPGNMPVRSDLARYHLHAAALAGSLNRIDDAARLRGEAATHLKWLLEKNPDDRYAKARLAKIQVIAAEADMRAGSESKGSQKLAVAEALLKDLPTGDAAPDGAGMQIAITKGLRAVFLRDSRQTSAAKKSLDEAIAIAKKITDEYPKATEPLYRLSVFTWQRAGLSGDTGDRQNELKLGSDAAAMMQRLLDQGAGKRDTELRRSLAYLHGDLGHIATRVGKKKEAATHFKKASDMWQSLIKKLGNEDEYKEGLSWSRRRYREVSGE